MSTSTCVFTTVFATADELLPERQDNAAPVAGARYFAMMATKGDSSPAMAVCPRRAR